MDALPTRRRSGLLVPRTGWIDRAACSQNHDGGWPELLIALWRFVIDGVLPEGAVLKPAA
jgi:hypothetical protein